MPNSFIKISQILILKFLNESAFEDYKQKVDDYLENYKVLPYVYGCNDRLSFFTLIRKFNYIKKIKNKC